MRYLIYILAIILIPFFTVHKVEASQQNSFIDVFTYSRNKQGENVTSPVTFNFSIDNIYNEGGNIEFPKAYQFNVTDRDGNYIYSSGCYDIEENSPLNSVTVNFPVGSQVRETEFAIAGNMIDCIGGNNFITARYTEIIDGDTPIFTIVERTEIETMIEDANTGYAEVTGENMGATVAWTGDNLIKLFLGSGLAVLYNLRYWIVALVIMSVIIYFAFKNRIIKNKIKTKK